MNSDVTVTDPKIPLMKTI